MGLLDDLNAAAGSLDPSLQPTSNQMGPLLGALVQYQEHGDKFLKAAEEGPAAVSELAAGDDASKDKSASKDTADSSSSSSSGKSGKS